MPPPEQDGGTMSKTEIAKRAAEAAVFQRRQGDRRNLRTLWRRSYSLLRYFHHVWEAEALAR